MAIAVGYGGPILLPTEEVERVEALLLLNHKQHRLAELNCPAWAL